MVSQILKDLEIKHKVKVGYVKNESHCWVELDDIIIDPTKSQFVANLSKDDYESFHEEKK